MHSREPEETIDGRAAPGAARIAAYGVGQLGFGVCEYALQFTTVAYYGHVVGLSSQTIATSLASTWIITGCLGPVIGVAWDRFQTSDRRRFRPQFWIAATLMAVGHYLVLTPPTDLRGQSALPWLIATLLLTRAAMMSLRVPYLAIGARMVQGYHERTKLAGVRTAFGSAGELVALLLAYLVFLRADVAQPLGLLNVAGYHKIAVSGAFLIFVIAMLCTVLIDVRDARDAAETDPVQAARTRDVVSYVSAIASMKPFQALLLCVLVVGLIQGMSGGLVAQAYTDLFIGAKGLLITLPGMTGLLLGSLVWSRIRIDKRTAYVAGATAFAAISLFPVITRLLYPPDRSDSVLHGVASLASPMVSWIFGAALVVTIEAMAADLSDVERLRTGRRAEGLLFGLACAVQSAGAAAGRWFDGHATVYGFKIFRGSAEEIDPWKTLQLSPVIISVAAVAIAGAFVMARRQSLGEQSHQDTLRLLARRSRTRATGGSPTSADRNTAGQHVPG